MHEQPTEARSTVNAILQSHTLAIMAANDRADRRRALVEHTLDRQPITLEPEIVNDRAFVVTEIKVLLGSWNLAAILGDAIEIEANPNARADVVFERDAAGRICGLAIRELVALTSEDDPPALTGLTPVLWDDGATLAFAQLGGEDQATVTWDRERRCYVGGYGI
jgi:hypothetical protein